MIVGMEEIVMVGRGGREEIMMVGLGGEGGRRL